MTAQRNHYRRELVQSVLAFVAAFTLTVLWHELGHGLTAKALGYSPVVYSGHEDDPASSLRDSVLIAAAGPLLSLVTGLVLLAVSRSLAPDSGRAGCCWPGSGCWASRPSPAIC